LTYTATSGKLVPWAPPGRGAPGSKGLITVSWGPRHRIFYIAKTRVMGLRYCMVKIRPGQNTLY